MFKHKSSSHCFRNSAAKLCTSTMFLLLSNLYIECYNEDKKSFSTLDQLSVRQKQGVYSVLRTGITTLHRLVGSVEKRSLLQTKWDFLEEKQREVNQVLRQLLPLLINLNPRKRDSSELLFEVDAIPEGLADGVVLELGASQLSAPALQLPSSSLHGCSWHNSDTENEILVWRVGFKIYIALLDHVYSARLNHRIQN